MKKTLIATISFLFLMSATTGAFAHAQITSSVPLKNKTIKTMPQIVYVEFDGDLITIDGQAVNTISVTNTKKKRVDTGKTLVGGSRLSTYLKPNLPAGKYAVTYRVVSEDGHPIHGSYTFTYLP